MALALVLALQDGVLIPKLPTWEAKKTAVVVCDMWDKHWCAGATRRVGQMAPRLNELVAAARRRGSLIIHCPSDTMDFYKDTPQRKLAQAAPAVEPKVPLQRWCKLDPAKEGALPIDDSDGGCDDEPQCKSGRAWSRQIETIRIEEGDAITDSAEAYYLMRQRGIENVLITGVHTNMCVLGRPFSIRQLVAQGLNVALVRDLTDTMYNSRKAPFVSHFTGTDRVVEHIERHWCPSITSADVLGGAPFRYPDDTRVRLTIVVSEDEYKTWETLPAFASEALGKEFRVSLVVSKDNNLPGLEALAESDLLLVSMRRRTPPKAQLDAIRKFIGAGKPVVAIRTSSHAFSLREGNPPEGHDAWPEFDEKILGGHYTGHHGNTVETFVRVTDREHPITAGLPEGEWRSSGSLYETSPLSPKAKVLLMGRAGDLKPEEPVAWTHATPAGGRVFYTSLGHPDDFKNEAFRKLLLQGLRWAAGDKKQGLRTPGEFNVAEDLEWELVLSEPEVRQPVHLSFDERGRLWVVQYLQYPYPAGLTLVSHDKHWRAVYDQVPKPPPDHVPGRDKITIHEDTDGDGKFDKHKTFVEGLNIATSCVRGRGGVWVLNPPYLLFYPDRDDDDVPDGPPQVHLSGFGLEDTHSVVNSLRWGPDGWLYAAQGSTVSGAVKRPGTADPAVQSMGQLIWRYDGNGRYEIFAEGGGNAFGVEMDSRGRIFSGHNGGDTRGFHYIQGAYLRKGFEKHGPLSNPYAFGYFEPMAHHKVERFTHTFVIYEGGALPEPYRGRLIGVEPLQGRLVLSRIEPVGSTFKTIDVGHPVTSTDGRFRPVDIKPGPDGALYVADFYENKIAHRDHFEHQIDRESGRVYRLKAKGAAPVRVDFSNPPVLLHHPNRWVRETALRLIREAPPVTSVETLWANHRLGKLTPQTLAHADPQIRLWTVRLLCDDRSADVPALAALAAREPDLEVRIQLACSARRLKDGLPILRALMARDEDADDPRQPLLLWWGIEALDTNPAHVLDDALWQRPIVRRHILERLMRRHAMEGLRENLLACTWLLEHSPDRECTSRLVEGFEKAYKGRSLAALPDALLKALGNSPLLGLRRGDPEAVARALAVVADPKAADRTTLIDVLGETHPPAALPALLAAIKEPALQKAALSALQRYTDPAIGAVVVQQYKSLTEDGGEVALTLLASRPAWSLALLDAIDAGRIDASEIPTATARKILLHRQERAIRRWGTLKGAPTEESNREIARLTAAIAAGRGDPYKGKLTFGARCAKCHTLFTQGGAIGPDLTPYARDDVESLLRSIVTPSAEIREGFETIVVDTKDGARVDGFLVERDNRLLVLRSSDGQNATVPVEEIANERTAPLSLMPEELLRGLDDAGVSDLFAYLRSAQPLNE